MSEDPHRYGQVLFELAKTDDTDLNSALKRITDADARILKVERVSVWLFREDRRAITCRNLFSLSKNGHAGGQCLEADKFPRYFQALEESRLVDASDAQNDPRTSEFAEEYLKPLNITSMMDVPVRQHGKVAGVVCHEHVGPKRSWSLDEKEFATSIADLVSLALEADERRKLLSLLRATLESTADGILVVDREGGIVSYNQKFVQMWKIPPEIMETKDDEKALRFVLEQLKDPEVFLKKVRDLYAQPEAESLDELEFKDGRVFERYSQPHRIGGMSVGRVWSFRDVTIQRQAFEEMKKLNQIKTNFASIVSHELKTPLAAIQESLGVTLDGLDGPVTPAQRKTLEIGKQNAEWLARLISNFLTFTKIESGKMEMRFGPIDARTLVEDACRLMKPAADRKGISLMKFLPPKPVEVRWDNDKMKTVLLNLIDNAIKFTDAGGHIRVRVERTGSLEVKIEVEDTGIGIRDEDKEQIFDMFAQAAARGPWRTGGFGIGLAVCRYMVEQHRGRLTVEGRPGSGSRFLSVIPAEPSSA